MPVKKNKKINKKTTTKKAGKKIKNEIKQAVEQIPGLMFEHVNIEQAPEIEKENISANEPAKRIIINQPQAPKYQEPAGSRKLLWFSVITFTVVIFAMWIMNTWTTLRNIKSGEIGTIDLIGDTKKNLDSALEKVNLETGVTTTQLADLEKIKNQIKTNLESIITYDQQTSTTVTSTN